MSADDDPGPDAALLAGTWSCVGVPWPTAAANPMPIHGVVLDGGGGVGLGDATVEVRNLDDDSLYGMDTTSNTNFSKGGYSVYVASGGVAPRIYRKVTAPGYVEQYVIDPMAQFGDFSFGSPLPTAADLDSIYAVAGLTRDPSKGTVILDINDCVIPTTGKPLHRVAGATVDAPSGTVLYGDADGYNASLTSMGVMGLTAVLNVDPGSVDFTVHAGPITFRSWPIDVHAGAAHWSPRHP
jgi:hypothetical protein